MIVNLKLITAPTAEPVTLALAKSHIRIADTSFDELITQYISSARQYCENAAHRAFFNQTWQLTLDHFPIANWWRGTARNTDRQNQWFYSDMWKGYEIKVPRPRLVSVTSITYVDTANQQQTLDPSVYVVDGNSEPGRIVPVPGQFWPSIEQFRPGTIQIQFIAGSYGDGSDLSKVPPGVVSAVLFMTNYLFEHPDAAGEDRDLTSLAAKVMPASEKFGTFDYVDN